MQSDEVDTFSAALLGVDGVADVWLVLLAVLVKRSLPAVRVNSVLDIEGKFGS
jgi:hypothetical protein